MEQEEQVHRFPPHCRRPKPRKLLSQPCFHHMLVTEPEPGNQAPGRGVLFPSAPSQDSPPSVEVEDTAGQQGKCFVTLQQLGSPSSGTPATSQELNAIRVYTFQSPVISLSPRHSLRRTQAAGKGRSSSQELHRRPLLSRTAFFSISNNVCLKSLRRGEEKSRA